MNPSFLKEKSVVAAKFLRAIVDERLLTCKDVPMLGLPPNDAATSHSSMRSKLYIPKRGKILHKIFQKKKRSKRSKEIYQIMKNRHIDGRWTGFSDSSDENAVWNWLSHIQEKYLTNACGIYCTTSTTTELVGAEARRQLDFFIKRRTDTVDIGHDWKDVRVIGEHRISQKEWKKKFLQIDRYVRDVFSVQPTRRFVHAFTLLSTITELWVFDRSSPYSSKPINIHDEPEKCIQALVGYI